MERKSQSFQIKKTELVPVKDPYQLLRNLKAENIIPERKYKQLKVQLRDRQETGMSELLAWLEKEAPEKIGPFWNTAQRGGAQACTELQLCRADHAPVRELVLPVTCGGKQGRFDVGKYLEGQPCVLANRKWMSPREFEEHGGKGRSHKWKSSIRYKSRPLGALLEGDQPAKPVPKRKPTRSQSQIKSTASPEVKRRKRSSSADSRETVHRAQQTSTESEESDGVSWRSSDTEEEDESEESSEEEEEDSPFSSGQEEQEEEEGGERGGSVFVYRDVLAVTCGSDKGKLYRKRFANACRGRCIRTFRQWCTPLEFCRTGTPGADEGNWAQSIWHMGVPLANLIQLGILRPHPEDCNCVKCVPVVKKNKDKPDECKSCGQGRDLLCCDQCFRLFHGECHLPPLPGQADPQAEWICTLCEFSRTLVLLPGIHSRSEVLGLEMQSQQAKCVYLLLRLYCKQNSGPFTKNPSSLKRYCEIIKRPMWLDKVKEKLLEQKYQQVGQFVQDIRLIFQNCVQYNKKYFYKRMGKELGRFFERQFEHVFNIGYEDQKPWQPQ